MPLKCTVCGTDVQPQIRNCLGCGGDVGFPNVRFASRPEEQDALQKRFSDAQKLAVARGTTKEFQSFMDEAGYSRAVMNRHLAALSNWIESTNPLFGSFHKQVDQTARMPTASNYDMQRESAESAVNPFFFKEINYAALSLDETGMRFYGPYCLVLKDVMLKDRSTIFEENPFEFNQRHRVISGQLPPHGFRTVWQDRGRLAATKLQHKIERRMQPIEFPKVLMEDRRDEPDCDYVEVHIYGDLHRTSIEKVIGPEPASRQDRAVWRRTARALKKLGAVVEVEVAPCEH